MTADLASTSEGARARGLRRPRWTGAFALATTVVVAVAAVWLLQRTGGADASLFVREEATPGAAQPLDGQRIEGRANVFVRTEGEVDYVTYSLADQDGRVRFAGVAWSAPFALSTAGADPLSAGTLAPGDYALAATVGFTDGRQTEARAAFTIQAQAAEASGPETDDGSRASGTEVEPGAPAESGRPGPHNTGPRVPDSELRPSEALRVTEDDTVVEGLDIAGTLVIEADNVVVRDTRVRSSAPYPVRAMPGTSGTLIEHVEVDGEYSLDNNGCIMGAGVTVRHSELHRCTDGAKVGSSSVYEHNWIHDPTRDDSGGGTDGHGNHVDGLQSTGGSDIVIRGNSIDMLATGGHVSNSAIILKSDLGAITGCLIEGNWLNGGNYTIYLREGGHGPPRACVVRDNRFGRDFQHGLLSVQGDVALSGNVWDDDGRPVPE